MDEIFFFFLSLSWIAIVKQAYIHYSSIISTIRERERDIYIYIFRSISREYRSSSVKGESKRNISSPELRETIIPPPFSFFPSLHHLTPYTTTKPNSDNPSSPNPNSTPQTYNFSPNTSHYPHYSNTSHPPPTPAISTEAVQV